MPDLTSSPLVIDEIPGPPPVLATDEHTRAFLASIVESSDDSIIGTDLDGNILSWNGGAERLWGYAAHEVLGRHIRILFPPSRQQDYLESLDKIGRLRRVGPIERFESVRMRKDGTLVDVSVILSPIRDDAGRICGVSAIYSDITQQKRDAADLRRAKEVAEAASRAKSEFLANMSHEIRTPMNGVMGMLEVALGMDISTELRDYLETAHASAHTLLTLLNDVLDFSKIEAGRMELEQVPLSIAAIADEAVSAMAVLARNKGLDLRYEIADDLPLVVLGDPTRLRQVLVNLINNSIKFTTHGSVVVRASEGAADSAEAIIQFAVADTGIGMPEAQQKVIFEAFRQGDGSTTRRYGGTGLGLSICQRLVKLMGGEMQVESEPDRGSTFSFSVRLKRTADIEAALRY